MLRHAVSAFDRCAFHDVLHCVFERPSHSTCDYIVKKVWFESASGLTSAQLQKLHSLVEGRCYDPAKPDAVSKYVYDQLRQWGYRKVKVNDPDRFQVVDESVHPSPVTFVVDFRVNDP